MEGPGGDGDGRLLGRPPLPGRQPAGVRCVARRRRAPATGSLRLTARAPRPVPPAGYVTTNARYLALVEDAIAPENVPLQTTRDNEICVLMAHVHRLFTESLLNPFATPQSPIASPRFDAGVTKLVRGLNEG